MAIKIGINGLGRIGRMVVRSLYENNYKDIEIKHINNRSNSRTASQLLKYDSIHGKFNCEIKSDNNHLVLKSKKITYTQHTKLEDINWKKHGVDYVLECTGKFNSKEKILPHIKNGAKKVIVSAPCKQSEKGFMTTIHSFTTDQRLLDNSHKDPRRARSAVQSIVPTSTGASKSIGEIIPDLKGKLEGIAMRVPTPNVSLIELVFCTKKNLTIEKINDALFKSSKKNLKGILEVTNEKLVSTDFNHNSNSAIVDASLTNVVGKNMGKISAWYDNEWGFSNRMCDLVKFISKKI